MKLEETNFYKERFSLGSSRLKVYYGIDKLNKIMTLEAKETDIEVEWIFKKNN